MNLITFITQLKSVKETLQPGGEGYNTVLREIALGSLGLIKMRIHEEGKAVDGSDIGQYNKTTPLYVNPNNSPVKFTPAGKPKPGKKQRKTKVNGKERKTRYFTSYDDFKTYIGRNELNKVNLFLTGDLQNQFTVIATDKGFGLGWTNEEKLIIAKAMEVKYGKVIYGLSEDERQKALQTGTDVANEVVINALS